MQDTLGKIPTLLTVPESSKLLRRSVPSLRRDLRLNKMAYVVIGGSIRITADEIHRTIKAGTVEAR